MSQKKQAAQINNRFKVVASLENFEDVPSAKRKEQAKKDLYITRI